MIERSAAPGGVWGWLLVGLWLALAPWVGATAQESPSRQAILDVFCQGNTEQRLGAIADLEALFLTGGASRAWAQETVSFLLARGLRCGDGVILFRNRQRDHFDALSLEPVAPPEERTKSPIVNLRLRGRLEVADGAMALLTTVDAAQQLEAMALLQRRYQDLNPRFIAEAQRVVQDEGVAAGLRDIQSLLALSAPDKATRLGAIARTAQQPSQRNLTLLTGRLADPDYSADDDIRQALEAAIAEIEYQQTLAESLAVAYSGLSYASVLFMAALGLAIIFGLMGVINLAQGEFIMLGAYVTFMVQQAFALWAPGLLDWYLLAAIPFAFGVTGLIGVAVEGSVIRHLYGRPLMTLLATWAVGVVVLNGVRVTLGPPNFELFTP
ncbi:MAG: urea ABC transporter permease subunit UrtB, partial [Candidatus Competibacterales bacterium]